MRQRSYHCPALHVNYAYIRTDLEAYVLVYSEYECSAAVVAVSVVVHVAASKAGILGDSLKQLHRQKTTRSVGRVASARRTSIREMAQESERRSKADRARIALFKKLSSPPFLSTSETSSSVTDDPPVINPEVNAVQQYTAAVYRRRRIREKRACFVCSRWIVMKRRHGSGRTAFASQRRNSFFPSGRYRNISRVHCCVN